MKKKIFAMLCIATVAIVLTSCTIFGDNQHTEPATEAPTEIHTELITEPPTETPTEPSTEAPTEPPTEPKEKEPENTTFAVTVNQPVTEAPTEAPTIAQTVDLLKPIVGNWYLNYYEQSNGQQTKPNAAITYTFNNDGTFSVDNRGNVSTGTYYFNGTTISYKADASDEIGEFTYNAAKKQITDVDESSQMSAVFTRTKSE